MPIIQVDHLTKEYRLGAMQGLKQTLLNGAARLTGKKVEAPPMFKALDDVNFSIEAGEVVGIIGHNGAGKSTLLKMLAKISTPTSGSIKVDGRIAPLIEVGAGFVPDFTGRENVYLNGAILGMSRQQIDKKFDEIVDFAEMAEFIDTPVKRYSSGMQVKLAFSVATCIESEILIVDEVLAVGDLAFQRKCFDRMEDLIKREGRTVLLVSHNIRQVERLCSRVILLNHGQVAADGNSSSVCNQFYDESNAKIKETVAQSKHPSISITEDMTVPTFKILDEKDNATDRIECLRPMRIRFEFEALRTLTELGFLVGFHTTDLIYLTANNTGSKVTWNFSPGRHVVILEIASMRLLPGIYALKAWIGSPNGKVSFAGENLFTVQVFSEDHQITRQQQMGLFFLDGSWVIDNERHDPYANILAKTVLCDDSKNFQPN
jgi:lipopolysaccharide transport system ATP-binding protein